MHTVFTIGHSTRSAEEFIELLKEHGVGLLIDVRRFPMSRRYPHFNKDELAAALSNSQIDYLHEEVLGGRRAPNENSRNTAWRNAQFRGYADHMDTPEYRLAVDRIAERAKTNTQAVMCAEAVPWRCHRNLLADALVARGIEVKHILQPGKANAHVLNKDAHVLEGAYIVYGPRVDQIDLL
jgi:uncharacterized protein (DUF488 family)